MPRTRAQIRRHSKNRIHARARSGRTRLNASPSLALRRVYSIQAWSVGVATTNDFWRYYAPTTTSFNNFAELASVFDQYKVNSIKYVFYPRYDSVDANPTTFSNTAVKFVTVVDQYSKLVPAGTYSFTSLNSVMEQSGVRIVNGLKPVTVVYRPRIAIPTNVGGGETYVSSSRMWLNTASTSVPFLGFHAYVATNSFSVPVGLSYDVFVTWNCTFKNLK